MALTQSKFLSLQEIFLAFQGILEDENNAQERRKKVENLTSLEAIQAPNNKLAQRLQQLLHNYLKLLSETSFAELHTAFSGYERCRTFLIDFFKDAQNALPSADLILAQHRELTAGNIDLTPWKSITAIGEFHRRGAITREIDALIISDDGTPEQQYTNIITATDRYAVEKADEVTQKVNVQKHPRWPFYQTLRAAAVFNLQKVLPSPQPQTAAPQTPVPVTQVPTIVMGTTEILTLEQRQLKVEAVARTTNRATDAAIALTAYRNICLTDFLANKYSLDKLFAHIDLDNHRFAPASDSNYSQLPEAIRAEINLRHLQANANQHIGFFAGDELTRFKLAIAEVTPEQFQTEANLQPALNTNLRLNKIILDLTDWFIKQQEIVAKLSSKDAREKYTPASLFPLFAIKKEFDTLNILDSSQQIITFSRVAQAAMQQVKDHYGYFSWCFNFNVEEALQGADREAAYLAAFEVKYKETVSVPSSDAPSTADAAEREPTPTYELFIPANLEPKLKDYFQACKDAEEAMLELASTIVTEGDQANTFDNLAKAMAYYQASLVYKKKYVALRDISPILVRNIPMTQKVSSKDSAISKLLATNVPMSFEEFLATTKLSIFHRRSAEIKAVDAALKAYDDSLGDDKKRIECLFELHFAIEAYRRTHAKPGTSGSNTKPLFDTDKYRRAGGVQKLAEQVEKALNVERIYCSQYTQINMSAIEAQLKARHATASQAATGSDLTQRLLDNQSVLYIRR